MAAAVDAGLLDEKPVLTGMTKRQLVALMLSTLLMVSFVTVLAVFNDSPEVKNTAEVASQEDGWRPFSVVAPIDTGINVYHDHFRTNETYPQWLQDQLGVNRGV